VKYNYFHKEHKRNFKNDPFPQENIYYNPQGDYLICPMGQQMHLIAEKTLINEQCPSAHDSDTSGKKLCGSCTAK
jgi:hypothetical protein